MYAPDEFLTTLARCDELPFVERRKKLRFRRHLDLVIIGPNDRDLVLYDISSIGLLFGEDYSWEKSGHGKRLKEFMGRHPRASVLLIPARLGAYHRDITDQLQRAFPDVRWLFPKVRDYHNNPMARLLIEDLCASRILDHC